MGHSTTYCTFFQKRFLQADQDGSGDIDYEEFCTVLDVDAGPLASLLFNLFGAFTGTYPVFREKVALLFPAGGQVEICATVVIVRSYQVKVNSLSVQ